MFSVGFSIESDVWSLCVEPASLSSPALHPGILSLFCLEEKNSHHRAKSAMLRVFFAFQAHQNGFLKKLCGHSHRLELDITRQQTAGNITPGIQRK